MTTVEQIVDPKPRPDGLCLVCLEKRTRPKHGGYATRAQFDADPFCSRQCAEAHYGIKPRKGPSS